MNKRNCEEENLERDWDKVGIHLKPEQIRKKYADLLSRYRKYREECSTSGNGKITYLYSGVFDKSLGSGDVNDPVAKFEVGGEFPNVKTHRPINERVEVAADGNSKNSVKRSEHKESTKDEYMRKKMKVMDVFLKESYLEIELNEYKEETDNKLDTIGSQLKEILEKLNKK